MTHPSFSYLNVHLDHRTLYTLGTILSEDILYFMIQSLLFYRKKKAIWSMCQLACPFTKTNTLCGVKVVKFHTRRWKKLYISVNFSQKNQEILFTPWICFWMYSLQIQVLLFSLIFYVLILSFNLANQSIVSVKSKDTLMRIFWFKLILSSLLSLLLFLGMAMLIMCLKRSMENKI